MYEEVPETVPLEFSEDDIIWVASKLLGAAGALVVEVLKLKNCLLGFGCASQKLWVEVAGLAYWLVK